MTTHPNRVANSRNKSEVGPIRGGSRYGWMEDDEGNMYPVRHISGRTRRSRELGGILGRDGNGDQHSGKRTILLVIAKVSTLTDSSSLGPLLYSL